ncbi:hypothetical protein DFH08DRAFT_973012 [Mycena albidolilacea]|uniref:Uncharacterized protein n=1 Tax=Mycena albidolilacea TaxID=1033008 RepID=A0AAD7EE38_9AGAR|nr:hypothetical protein DFH08DRAFT_973012 [Mycena albidolilacea]
MITAINACEFADLQKRDSVIKAARANLEPNHGGEVLDPYTSAFAACHDHPRRSTQTSAPLSRSSRSAGGKEFDWTNTKNRSDVCNRCGIPGFAQYCVSIMPDDVRHRFIRNREHQAHLADNGSSDDREDAHITATAVDTNSHLALAVHDLPFEINLDTMDPEAREGFAAAYAVPYHAHNSDVDHHPTPPSPTLTASTSSIAGTPTKKKGKKKKKPSATAEDAQVAMRELSLKEEEEEFTM